MKSAHRELSRKEYSGKEYSVYAFLMATIFGFLEYFMKA